MAIKLVTVLLFFINGNKISHGTLVFYEYQYKQSWYRFVR